MMGEQSQSEWRMPAEKDTQLAACMPDKLGRTYSATTTAPVVALDLRCATWNDWPQATCSITT
jgi:hypothetical protein